MFGVIFQKKDFSEVEPRNLQDLFEHYDAVYACKVKNFEELFRLGNSKLPLKYSLSVGDVVVIKTRNRMTAYLVAPIGWKKLFTII